MQLNVLGIIIILAIILGTFFLGKGFGRLDRDNQLQEASQALNDQLQTLKRYEITIDSLTEYVSQMEYVVVTDQQMITNLRLDNDRFKQLNMVSVETIAKLKSDVEVLNKKLTATTEPVIRIDDMSMTVDGGQPQPKAKPCLELPMEYRYQDRWAFNNTKIGLDGQAVSDFGLYTTPINVVIGQQRLKWYKNKEGVIAITTPNPYLKVDPHQVVLIKTKPKWYQRNLTWFLGGAVTGYLLH